jgi:hypothetical protein
VTSMKASPRVTGSRPSISRCTPQPPGSARHRYGSLLSLPPSMTTALSAAE